MNRKRLAGYVGFIATWAIPVAKLALFIVGLAGVPGDLAAWQALLYQLGKQFSVLDWVLLAVGLGCLWLASGRGLPFTGQAAVVTLDEGHSDQPHYQPHPSVVDVIIEAKRESNLRAANAVAKGERNTGVAHALGWAIHADWDRPVGNIFAIPLMRINLDGPIEKLREAARNGRLRVWGRREPSGLFELIGQDFWEDNTIHEASLNSPLNPTSTIPFEGVESKLRFYDIRLNRAEVERVWPHAG